MDKDLRLFEVNLSVAAACNADCLFCPRSSNKPDQKMMKVELVEKIMAEVSSPEFKSVHPVVHCVPSENGEPFLNPWILDILRVIRRTGLGITLFSNFGLLYENMAKTVITEGLCDAIHVNIDGATPETYGAVKGLDLNVVETNLKAFVRLRNEWGSPIRIFAHVISHYTYTEAVSRAFGAVPVKAKEPRFLQDGPETVKKWQGILNPDLDTIGEDGVMFWAERYGNVRRPGSFKCPNISRLRHVAYINPEGNVYVCCFDAGNDVVLGNVYENTLLEISDSQRRRDIIQKLEEGRFDEIGWPCSRVDACSGMGRAEIC